MSYPKESFFSRVYVLLVILTLAAVPGLADYKKVGGGLNFFSEQQEIAMGREYSQQLNQKLELIEDPFIHQYINQIGQKLVQQSLRPELKYQFFVVNSEEINAFALPGGFIYINRGLIEAADGENELAGVVSHEIGHVVGRHSTKQMSKKLLLSGIVLGAGMAVGAKSDKWGDVVTALGGIGVFFAAMKYSRDDERQADWLGLTQMTRSGYDPNGMVSFFQKLEQLHGSSGGAGLAFMSTHPLPAERMRNMQQEIQNLDHVAANPVVTTYSFRQVQRKLAGLPPPPREKEQTLSAALRSLDQGTSTARAGSSPPAGATPAMRAQSRALTVPGNTVWVDTGIDVVQGQAVEIRASGRVFWKKNSNETCSPAGAPGTNKGFWKPISSVNTGALIAKVGDTYSYFYIGEQRSFQAPATGRLFLGINDDNPFDNRGGYNVQIRTGGR
ncbi:MAG: M48 family metalloprotease [Acidobacteria bacterium]|nr:M48 family metalloprotease [Acidobacteriota bacterium]